MSELFANLGGFRQPDVRMNQGPLPSVAGGPMGSNGTPDGRINASSSLLGAIEPYAYGESARAGSDSNYQQIPHRVQYIVMPLHLPAQNGLSTHKVSHVVDNGDLAFVLNTRGRQWFGPGENVASGGPISLPLFANIEVVNYMLACMQLAPLVAPGAPGKRSWTAIRAHLWKQAFDERKCRGDRVERAEHLFECVQYTLQNLFKPHGICAGSEKQGGQHEETWAPVQAAVNYTTTMTVDGQNRDLQNYWHSMHICAGDRLLLRLVPCNAKGAKNQPKEFHLTSYYKRPVSATISSDQLYWQLVPHILHADAPGKVDEDLEWHDYRLTGYWHIAQSFQGRRGFDSGAAAHKGAPLQVTFAPMFVPGDGGRRENPFFLRDAMDEFKYESEAQFFAAVTESAFGPDMYDPITLQAFLTKMGVRVATLKTLYAKPSQASFIGNILTTQASVIMAGSLGLFYKFAQEYRLYRMQQYILKLIHGAKFAELIKTKEADKNKILKRILDSAHIATDDPRLVAYIAKLSAGKSTPGKFFGGVGGAGGGGAGGGRRDGGGGGRRDDGVGGAGGGGTGGGRRDGGTPPHRVVNPHVLGDAAPAFEAMLAEQASLASALDKAANSNAEKSGRAKAARKRSALFTPVDEGGAAADSSEV